MQTKCEIIFGNQNGPELGAGAKLVPRWHSLDVRSMIPLFDGSELALFSHHLKLFAARPTSTPCLWPLRPAAFALPKLTPAMTSQKVWLAATKRTRNKSEQAGCRQRLDWNLLCHRRSSLAVA